MSDQAEKSSQVAAAPSDHASTSSLSLEPQDTVTINVEGKAFKVHKALLVKDSAYFEKALNGPFLESQTQIIDLGHDVEAADLAFYVDTLYRSYFIKDLDIYDRADRRGSFINTALRLWVLSDRFLNSPLRDIATRCLDRWLRRFTIQFWKTFYLSPWWSISELTTRVHDLQLQFVYCRKYNMPYTDKIVQAAAHMPPQLYHELHDTLTLEFRSAVTKKFIRRFEDPGLTRPSEKAKLDERSDSPKRQRRN